MCAKGSTVRPMKPWSVSRDPFLMCFKRIRRESPSSDSTWPLVDFSVLEIRSAPRKESRSGPAFSTGLQPCQGGSGFHIRLPFSWVRFCWHGPPRGSGCHGSSGAARHCNRPAIGRYRRGLATRSRSYADKCIRISLRGPAVQRPPEAFDHTIVDPAALAIHRYLHLGILQLIDPVAAGELRSQTGVEDLRRAICGQRLLRGRDAKSPPPVCSTAARPEPCGCTSP